MTLPPPSTQPNPQALTSKHLSGKRILLTGAGGSIGSALAQAIAASSPASLLLLDASEHALYQIDRDLPTPHVSLLGSVCDPALLAEIFELHQPEIVFHAAAFKHVPLLERQPFAAIANNVLGTYALLEAATQHHAEHLVLVSTDKAVDPSSLMGASKRIAELLLLASTSTTRLTAVRLGNVLGSRGSVLPLFLDQIARSGPVTVTHPEASRYFLSLDQCIEALLAALEPAVLEPAALEPQPPSPLKKEIIFLPHLNTPIRIADLARDLIASHASSASLVFTQLRPGDKLEESLLSPRESLLPETGNQKQTLTAISSPAPSAATLHAAMRTLQQAITNRDLPALLHTILQLVPEYTPSALLLEAARQSPRTLQEARA
ncbi:polysaccharide biosynthesis protein [Tunturiibacter empetritectus]|uniref:FlaA1/EpsC-like NDP-sugar epimerase n=2 Tax=Tunturiibacter TaxID=3154218 RepID=A0A852VGX8_9BACT|nr:FlaA1/EpsC-like NDP-sugar epimerase [Edaphobacter lichenicola]